MSGVLGTDYTYHPERLSPRQREVLDVIREYIDKHGCSPSYREVGQAFGFSSSNASVEHVRALARKGYLRITGKHRGIVLLPSGRDRELWTHPVEPGRFAGPFGKRDDALRSATASERPLKRCRPVRGSEALGPSALELLVDHANDQIDDGHEPDAWGDRESGDALATARPGASEALREWADRYLQVDLYKNIPETR